MKGANKMKVSEILNNEKYDTIKKQVIENKLQKYGASEIAYIDRFLNGDTWLKVDVHFSKLNLDLLKPLLTK
jgi:hypothetical protein